jgi:hypothetical protein
MKLFLLDLAAILAHFGRSGQKKWVWIDRFPQRTIKWLSLPVHADPFWARLSCFAGASGQKTQQAQESRPVPAALVCAERDFAKFDWQTLHDI